MDEGIKKIAALIRAADVIHDEMQKKADANPEPTQEEAAKEAGLSSILSGIGSSIGSRASKIGVGAKDLASQLARSRAGLPIAGGLAGAGVATPFALGQFAEGDVGEGLAALGAGAGMGTGAGFLGRDLSTLAKGMQDFTGQSKYKKIMAALTGAV